MKTRRPKQDPLLIACALIPLAGLAALYSLAIRARVALGEWPLPYRPDPKTLGFDLHHGAVGVLLVAAIASPLALGVCVMVNRPGVDRARRMTLSVATYGIAYAALWALLVADPGSVFEWYAD